MSAFKQLLSITFHGQNASCPLLQQGERMAVPSYLLSSPIGLAFHHSKPTVFDGRRLIHYKFLFHTLHTKLLSYGFLSIPLTVTSKFGVHFQPIKKTTFTGCRTLLGTLYLFSSYALRCLIACSQSIKLPRCWLFCRIF